MDFLHSLGLSLINTEVEGGQSRVSSFKVDRQPPQRHLRVARLDTGAWAVVLICRLLIEGVALEFFVWCFSFYYYWGVCTCVETHKYNLLSMFILLVCVLLGQITWY